MNCQHIIHVCVDSNRYADFPSTTTDLSTLTSCCQQSTLKTYVYLSRHYYVICVHSACHFRHVDHRFVFIYPLIFVYSRVLFLYNLLYFTMLLARLGIYEHRGGAPIGAGGHDPTFRGKGGRGHKVNVENTKITTENISTSVSQLQIKQRN